MSITDKKNPTRTDYHKPTFNTLSQRVYPLERSVYLHTKEPGFGLGQGFIRYCCFQIGQLIVEKMGLLPYYKFKREIELEKKPIPKISTK